MLWRHLCLVRAWSAAGLVSVLTIGAASAADEPSEPLPVAESRAETVKILEAAKAGDLNLDVRGHGQSQVKVAIKNISGKRLNVVLPPGLVASSTIGQAPGGGLQSMGLGAPTNRPGAFGRFNAAGEGGGFRSMGLASETNPSSVAIAAGQAVELDMPAVCLNFGLPSPTLKNKLTLVDVDDHTRDPRVRKALRSVATFGTSQGTAQAVMWNVCNNVPFETMVAEGEKVVNRHEVALASRFIEALDASTATDLVDPAYLTEARIFVTVLGQSGLEKDALRLASEMEGLRILGLPVRVSVAKELPRASAPSLHLLVELTGSKPGETTGKISVRHAVGLGQASDWAPLGQTSLKETSVASALKGIDLARAVDHSVAAAFVSVKPARKAIGVTSVRIENRLPFSLASVTLKAGGSAGAPPVTFSGLGIGPARSAVASLVAPTGTIDRVELNGL